MRVARARNLGRSVIGVLLVATFVLSACSSGDDGDARPATTASPTTGSTTTAPPETTTEALPGPITAEEEEWVAALTQLRASLSA